MFSVLILTLNEEARLPRCLASVTGCDDLVILDSGSTDRTVAVALSAGARVFTRKFDNFAAQRNFAQQEIAFRHPWVFHLDADEQFTPELFAECHLSSAARHFDGFYVAPKMIFEGRWIPHCTDFPAWQARFVQAPRFAFISAGHGQRESAGLRLGYLHSNYLHDLSSEGEAAWLEKHRRYAEAEAQAFLAAPRDQSPRGLFSRDRLIRRRTLKRLSYSLPFRSVFRFFYQYGLRGGFLDGRPGWRYCRLLARYEAFATEALHRLRR